MSVVHIGADGDGSYGRRTLASIRAVEKDVNKNLFAAEVKAAGQDVFIMYNGERYTRYRGGEGRGGRAAGTAMWWRRAGGEGPSCVQEGSCVDAGVPVARLRRHRPRFVPLAQPTPSRPPWSRQATTSSTRATRSWAP